MFWSDSANKYDGLSSHSIGVTNAKNGGSSHFIIPVFYNVYANPAEKGDAKEYKYANEQMSLLLPEHQVFIRSIGKSFKVENATHIQHDDEGSEGGTLKLLWTYCKTHGMDSPDKKVVYLHNKGSFHPKKSNDILRRWLTRAALSKECTNMPPFCNVCSYRMSPMPHPHTSGNMWAARCEYIRKLMDPMLFQQKMAQLYGNHGNPMIGTGRYAFEHWVHSHPSILPCDLSTSEYIWDYHGLPEQNHDEFKLEAAPRYDRNTFFRIAARDIPYMRSYELPRTIDKHLTLDHRLDEYIFLYNETPPYSWFGWKFYNDTK